MKAATLLKVDGTETVITPANGTDFTLEECYKHIGCDLVEVVRLDTVAPTEMIMIVDEEALMKDELVVNQKASAIARRARAAEGICGNAILCDADMFR